MAVTIDKKTKVSLGAIVAAILLAIGIMQPVVSAAVGMMITDTAWKTRMEGRVSATEQDVAELKPAVQYLTRAVYRLEAKLGTLPEELRQRGEPR